MAEIKMRMSTHARLLKDVLTHYKSTFHALKELINNSIQANAKCININLIPSTCDEDSIMYRPIESIEVIDDGCGVATSSFEDTIMNIATDNKEGGMGIGRFGALQIGNVMSIETVGFDPVNNKKTQTSIILRSSDLTKKNLSEHTFDVITKDVDMSTNTYYKVKIEELYTYSYDSAKKNKLSEEFISIDNFKQALFESYPFEIFEGEKSFKVNSEELSRIQFCIGTPILKTMPYTDAKGECHDVNLHFYNVNLKDKDINIFFQVDNAGVMTSVARYQYTSPWHTPDAGTWYIMVDSDFITRDMMSNFELADLGEQDAKGIQELIKNAIDTFFRESNVKYTSFIEKLTKDKSYPYPSINASDRPSLEINVFNHTAYLLELEQGLIESNNTARRTIYPMIKKVIEDGNTEFLVSNVIQLSDEKRQQFCKLLDSTDLDDVISFSSSVARHTQFLDFLNELCYGDVSKWLKERKQLHKIVERELWIFGEEYNESTRLWSDRSLEHNLEQLHKEFFSYEPTEEQENLIIESQEIDKDVTDLFLYNKKRLGNGREEVLIVELKAPSCAIANKEIEQIERYRDRILDSAAYPKDKTCYKIILISSKLSKGADRKVKGARSRNEETDPFLYSDYKENGADIKLYIMNWAELINENRKRLSYLSESLNVKEEDVNEKFLREYPELVDEKSRNRLNKRELR